MGLGSMGILIRIGSRYLSLVIPLPGIHCDTEDDEATQIWKDIAIDSGFLVLETPSRAFEAAEENKQTVRHADGGHLNILGNKITGEELAAQLANYVR